MPKEEKEEKITKNFSKLTIIYKTIMSSQIRHKRLVKIKKKERRVNKMSKKFPNQMYKYMHVSDVQK